MDFGHRGIHEMTRVAKAIVQAFYGEGARRSYFNGCSDGGREALMDAQGIPTQVYEGPRDAGGRRIFPGYLPGAEEGGGGWVTWIMRKQPKTSLMAMFGNAYFSHMVHGNPQWDYREFALEADLRAAIEKTAQALDSTDPNLTPFRARGGKLILYHGWQDPAIPAG